MDGMRSLMEQDCSSLYRDLKAFHFPGARPRYSSHTTGATSLCVLNIIPCLPISRLQEAMAEPRAFVYKEESALCIPFCNMQYFKP